MAFRIRHKGVLPQIAMSLVWVLISADKLTGHSRYDHSYTRGLNMFGLILWILNLVLYLSFYFFSSVQFTETSLRIRQNLRLVLIPYTSIVAFSQARDAKGKLKKGVIELEVAKLSRDIYPHQYRELQLKDMTGFLATLQQHVPQQS